MMLKLIANIDLDWGQYLIEPIEAVNYLCPG